MEGQKQTARVHIHVKSRHEEQKNTILFKNPNTPTLIDLKNLSLLDEDENKQHRGKNSPL